MKKVVSIAVVTGVGAFPVDMLRYDNCWPHHEHDSVAIAGSLQQYSMPEERRVEIIHSAVHSWTPARWASFGWKLEEK